MKWIVFSLIIFQTYVSNAQAQPDSALIKRKDSINVMIKKLSKPLMFAEIRNEELASFADSINHYKGGPLPNFLSNNCIDWDASYWPSLHEAKSVRWLILERVNNKHALKRILNVRDRNLTAHCSHIVDHVYPYLSVPMIQYSFYELIRKRYNQLQAISQQNMEK